MARRDAEKLVAAMTTPDDADMTPLGRVKVGKNNRTLTVSLPKETARGVGIARDMMMEVYYHADSGAFVYFPEESS